MDPFLKFGQNFQQHCFDLMADAASQDCFSVNQYTFILTLAEVGKLPEEVIEDIGYLGIATEKTRKHNAVDDHAERKD